MESKTEKTDLISDLFDNAHSSNIPYWKQYQEGKNGAAAAFLNEMNPTIDSAISRYAAGDPSYKTQARILALDAASSYNPKAGADIKTHVFNTLKRLQRISAQRGNLTRVPENAALQRRVVDKARRAFEIDNGYEPTTEELASITGFSRKRIDDLANYRAVAPDSLVVSPEGDSLVADRTTRGLDLYDQYIYDDLDRTDKKIYEWSTGYGGSPLISRKDMASKLGISEVAVAKRAKKISSKFNQDRELIRRGLYGEGRI